uniref:Zona pellucida sperm-binding protein 3 n=1 Tax=Neogobius melanostomus TaxID=47308 RepID=A0A8C6WSI2_9GOBI
MVDGRHLRLGVEQRRDPSACRAVPSGPTQFTVQAQLTDCGTVKLPPTEEKIIYSNVVIYSPEPSQDGLLRLGGATIPVECHYDKFYSVNTLSMLPTWASFVLRTTAESRIDFSLRLMTGDWKLERESHVYYVGDPIHFEGSCILGNHKPLRVFVDHCVATATPDPDAALRYDFIDHGCLADAYLTNSSARFLSRTEDHKIRFQLDAFTFYQENANQLYITCRLTAVLSMVNVESRHRVCSLIDNRWCSADGDDEDCTSCAIPYPPRKSLNRASSAARTDVKSAQAMTSRELGRKMPKQQPATHLLPTKMYTQLISLCWVNERRRKRKGESFIVL